MRSLKSTNFFLLSFFGRLRLAAESARGSKITLGPWKAALCHHMPSGLCNISVIALFGG